LILWEQSVLSARLTRTQTRMAAKEKKIERVKIHLRRRQIGTNISWDPKPKERSTPHGSNQGENLRTRGKWKKVCLRDDTTREKKRDWSKNKCKIFK